MPAPAVHRARAGTSWLSVGLLTAIALLVGACGPLPSARPDPATYADTRARALASDGQLAAAGEEYLRLAGVAPSPDAEQYRLTAADTFLATGDTSRASAALDHASLGTGIPAIALRRDILRAKIKIFEGDTLGALAQLRGMDLDRAPPYLAKEGRQLQARAMERSGDTAGAASERVALEFVLTEADEIAANRDAIWAALSSLSPDALTALRRPPPDTLGGWVELALMRNRHFADPAGLEAALAQWDHAFPGHPAGTTVRSHLLGEVQTFGGPATHIGLFLPISGQFAEAAIAIRDGFLANWFVTSGPSERPRVTIYDTGAASPTELVQNAAADGVDFIVGPLIKEAVSELVAAGPRMPVLALNTGVGNVSLQIGVEGTVGPSAVYYFALSPEGEAQQVAERARADGHARAAVLVPASEWGNRVSQAFSERWSQLGGSVVANGEFADDPNGLANSVRSMLRVDRSVRRAKRLSGVLGTSVEHEPRRRQDIDLIFLAAFPREARQLRPQIDFHRASRVPVYATSHVYAGQPSPNADGDVNGIIFGDMPWVLGSGAEGNYLREQVYALWSGASGAYTRFYAFGADAYRLVPHLGDLRARPGETLAGETGALFLDAHQHVHRQLDWAVFDDGVPKPLGPPDS